MKVMIPRTTVWWISVIVLTLMPAIQNRAALNLENAVGIWLFDEVVGNEIIDSSGKENHGTFANGAEPERIRRESSRERSYLMERMIPLTYRVRTA